jgi:predicted lipoprotein with Yx(FWY)xxD motif
MRSKWLAAGPLTAAVLMAAACSSSTSNSSSPASSPTAQGTSATALKTATISGTAVVTNAGGFTLYWFAPDTATKSNCNGGCAQIWPPVKGPATAGTGVTGKLSTITRSDGSSQATYNGRPVYTYTADTAPGQASGNGINAYGGVWHEVTVSGAVAPASSPSSGGGGY